MHWRCIFSKSKNRIHIQCFFQNSCKFFKTAFQLRNFIRKHQTQMAALDQKQISLLETSGSLTIQVDGQDVVVDAADVDIISEDIPGWLVSNEGNLTVALEVELSDELINEGMAREIINRIQNLRKDSGLEITDRIKVVIAPNEQTNAALAMYGEYIKGQVLADDITIADNDGVIEKFDVNITIEKV